MKNFDNTRISTASLTHRKVRKAVQHEPLRSLCSPWLNLFSTPAQERAPPQPAPAVHLRTSRAGGLAWRARG